MLQPNRPSRSFRSASKRLLTIPSAKLKKNAAVDHSHLQHLQFGTHCQNPYVIMMTFQNLKNILIKGLSE